MGQLEQDLDHGGLGAPTLLLLTSNLRLGTYSLTF